MPDCKQTFTIFFVILMDFFLNSSPELAGTLGIYPKLYFQLFASIFRILLN